MILTVNCTECDNEAPRYFTSLGEPICLDCAKDIVQQLENAE